MLSEVLKEKKSAKAMEIVTYTLTNTRGYIHTHKQIYAHLHIHTHVQDVNKLENKCYEYISKFLLSL